MGLRRRKIRRRQESSSSSSSSSSSAASRASRARRSSSSSYFDMPEEDSDENDGGEGDDGGERERRRRNREERWRRRRPREEEVEVERPQVLDKPKAGCRYRALSDLRKRCVEPCHVTQLFSALKEYQGNELTLLFQRDWFIPRTRSQVRGQPDRRRRACLAPLARLQTRESRGLRQLVALQLLREQVTHSSRE